jgi:peptidoglycan/LPS O-acetylase OafA/YrhL
MLMIQNWGFTQGLTWNDPAWSISCEFAAYLMFPVLVVATDWKRLHSFVLVGMLGLLATTLHSIMSAGGAPNLGFDIPRLGLPRALIEFSMGTILCVLWQRHREQAPRAIAACSAALALSAAAWLLGTAETLAVPVGASALLLILAFAGNGTHNPLSWWPIHYLGEISYSTYLAHFLFFIAFKLVFVEDGARIPIPLIALFLLLMLGVSMALFHLVERPAQRRLNRAFDQALKAPPEPGEPIEAR